MKKLAPYLRKLLYLIGLFLLIALLGFLNTRYAAQEVSGLKVKINAAPEARMLTEERVLELISIWYSGGLIGLPLLEIDINDIEEKLMMEAVIRHAEVSTQLNGVIQIEIDQRNPIVRVLAEDGFSFYLAENQKRIPISGLQPARVPVATIPLNDSMIKKIYTLSTYVNENVFMKALTEQIFVSEEGDLIIIPKLQHHQVVIGDTTNLHDKFAKLERFYKDGLMNIGWDTYRSINLKFKEQVVCN
jgi:cell division protein FtsQ